MILEFTSEAEGDLEQIADYIAEHNPRRALSFIRELRSRCEDLISHPNSFALVPRYEHHGIRRRVHGNYLIFYRVEPTKVVIIHILHGATDYGLFLFGE
ncbi:MAG: type II toxin-antitoxin system RelE/ParE family toxin [Desulfomicrobium sp.]|jgi:toxin ParE1/3/4|uniref:Type II toxin-antitoxin system RelE/ParE family toxin n=1 Tax=Peteryoungia ipomoeae TaxID=1210932 RepID=A0A4S8NU55_9HYPH|nr:MULTISPECIES: type II toxin-antitoxin system RelE/ParE family toxin [Hyphomicrobiales]MBU4529351.1 type II toxin-antitoxin system RelE/ParE family toxin [Alphaproteobacteria bacterium]MBV1712666.1 type II toxin-antitoxin system RelE/ParE family toxin [Desulfomicrobium sp.]MBU4545022.1 type II toxin-antitoxin system RelE/ParE family toxin [Alphaproteobacteria bacterium]MBU4552429.1 type II toxin-antitoxin system RelE/ParE family toxin [Alphaproteobacteria bacterium]MBV1783580.1 type II toxin